MISDRELELEEKKLRVSEINTLGFIVDRLSPKMDSDTKSLKAKAIKRLENLIGQ